MIAISVPKRFWSLALALGISLSCAAGCSDQFGSENSVQLPEVTGLAPEAITGNSDQFQNLPSPYSEADYDRGRRTYRLCQSCHTLAEGAPNLVGPNLYGLFDRKTGEAANYTYSQALRDADLVWTPARLDDWLANPRSFLPGNKMSFAGVRKPEDRTDLIAYIMLETGYEAPR